VRDRRAGCVVCHASDLGARWGRRCFRAQAQAGIGRDGNCRGQAGGHGRERAGDVGALTGFLRSRGCAKRRAIGKCKRSRGRPGQGGPGACGSGQPRADRTGPECGIRPAGLRVAGEAGQARRSGRQERSGERGRSRAPRAGHGADGACQAQERCSAAGDRSSRADRKTGAGDSRPRRDRDREGSGSLRQRGRAQASAR